MIGMKNNMSYVEYLVTLSNTIAQQFISSKLKGYTTEGREDLLAELDGDWDEEEEGFQIYSKVVSRELKMKEKLAAKRAKEGELLAKQLSAAMEAGVSFSTDATGAISANTAKTPTGKDTTSKQESPTSILDSVTKQ